MVDYKVTSGDVVVWNFDKLWGIVGELPQHLRNSAIIRRPGKVFHADFNAVLLVIVNPELGCQFDCD